jgi:L-seryl-tRNA(Ser) seleniumtransferase
LPDLPLLQLLTASVENLRNRAGRLAPQLAAAADFTAVETAPMQSQLLPAHMPQGCLPSYGLALRPATGDMRTLVRRIESGPRPAFGRVEDERLLLDLRFVFPREDEVLLEILLGDRPPASAA